MMIPRLKQAVADPAAAYLLRAGVWFVALLGLLRLPWVQTHLLLPYTRLQAGVAEGLLGEQLRVVVATSCSGSDAMAVCLGAILAFPAPWRRRLAAAAGGLAVITVVNTLRLAHLSRLAPDPELLDLFHLKVWPALIILVAAGYAFAWMRSATAPRREAAAAGAGGEPLPLPAWPVVALAALLVAFYYAFYDRLLASPLLAATAERTAAVAGGLMGFCGVPAKVDGGMLQTPGAAWLVTPECVTTPLIPIALAAVVAGRLSWKQRLAALLALPLVFQALAVARLMVLAVPRALVGSPLIAVHAFYQLLVAAALIVWLAARRGGGTRRAATALGIGCLVGLAAGFLDLQIVRPSLTGAAGGVHLGHGYVDPQGVLALLPGFQLGLLAALWAGRPGRLRPRELALPAALLTAAGAATVIVLGELSVHAAVELPVVAIRAWSLALPPFVVWSLGWTRDRRHQRAGSARRVPSAAA